MLSDLSRTGGPSVENLGNVLGNRTQAWSQHLKKAKSRNLQCFFRDWSNGTYEASPAGPRHVRRFSYESPVSVHLRLLGRAGTVLYCAVVLTPEVVSCAGARAVAGAGAGAGASAGRRFAFCLSIASLQFIWLVYCARTG